MCFLYTSNNFRLNGFTLAELLIALGILGVIATFTIPKLLQSQQNSEKKSVFKETIAALSDITYTGNISGDLTRDNINTFIFQKMNAVKICPADASSQGCWPNTHPAFNVGETTEGGATLHNGAVIAGIKATAVTDYESFIMDWNGPDSPNTEGDDQILLLLCWERGGCNGGTVKNGTVMADPASAASVTLYESTFSN